ncbi:nectin 1b-like isoform X1 [Paramormyrops kingsleyae]|uniref:Nectin cell adhesion molecule 1a n=1 Tax=Paramormyrops kingsleyae TaxID=1676925 RepID=A0A3B3T6P6_9TELE|nr:nectin-1-like [Paramormyrops kingsleyae]
MAVPATLWIYLMAVYLSGSNGQMVQMDAIKSGYVGSQVELHCLFINNNPAVKISQVTWQKFLNGTKQNVAIANPTMGVSVLNPFKERVSFKLPAVQEKIPSLEDTTIVFSNLQLSDEAAYICEYTTFPAGNRENMVNLTVFARPMIQMIQTALTIVAQPSSPKVSVATCLAANGKPPGVVTWETTLKGEPRTEEIPHSNGTVTVRSDYLVIPSREMHKQKLTCVVTYNNDTTIDTIMLNVQYKPEVKIVGFDGNWYLNRPDKLGLTCKTEANPPVTHFEWKLLNGSMPAGVEILNNTLSLKGPVTYDLAGTYVCHATNSIGTSSGQVEVNVTELPYIPNDRVSQERHNSGLIIGGAAGGIVVLLVALIILFVILRRRQRTFKGDYSTKKHVYGNGYSKPGGLSAHPTLPKNLPYGEDSDDEKKTSQMGGTGLYERSDRVFDDDDLKRPYFTVDESESHEYEERSLAYPYDHEVEITDDMVSQTDGSVISKKEWYV